MDIGSIKQKIVEDKAKRTVSYRRYPVRFLFMELNSNTQNDIMELVKSSNGELLELSDYIMKKDDGWLTKSRFMQVIKQNVSAEKDTYVVGLSEMIRFYSRKEIESTILSLFDIENSNISDEHTQTRRIYFICFSMMDSVYKVLQSCFPRKDLIDPFINAEFELSGKCREICFVSDEYAESIKTNKITTSVEWIGLWRHSEIIDFSTPIWCCSESLYEWHKKASPDNAFKIDVVSNSKEYLQKAYGGTFDFEYIREDENHWKTLIAYFEKQVKKAGLGDVVSEILGADINNFGQISGRFLTTDSQFEKWLIKSYVCAYCKDSYLFKVLSNLHTFSKKEFLLSVWRQGYKTSNAIYLQERLDIIRELNKYADSFIPENEIREIIIEGLSLESGIDFTVSDLQYGVNLLKVSTEKGQAIEDLKGRMSSYFFKVFKPAYTGISNVEKEFVINLYSEGVISKEAVKELYPMLYTYLFSSSEKTIVNKEECKYYLEAYRESKVHNKDNSYLMNYYKEGCASAENMYGLYYSLNKQDTVVNEMMDESTDVYVLDGVGAEYMPVLIELIKKNEYMIEHCDYAAAHLPTITDINKVYLSKIAYKEWFVDFDRDVVHGEYYHTVVNLRKAFDMLEKKIFDIINESNGKRIIITADHGATARARWTEGNNKYNFSGANHEGRCCKITSAGEYQNTEDYIVYEDEINPGVPYIISLNQTSLYNKPKYEDHGGATLEEMLVPIIVAVPHNVQKEIKYKVLDEKINVNGLEKEVSFVIIPEPQEAYLIEENMTKHLLKKVGESYQAELTSGKEQDVVVAIDDQEFKFHIINDSRKNMEGDDGFDD